MSEDKAASAANNAKNSNSKSPWYKTNRQFAADNNGRADDIEAQEEAREAAYMRDNPSNRSDYNERGESYRADAEQDARNAAYEAKMAGSKEQKAMAHMLDDIMQDNACEYAFQNSLKYLRDEKDLAVIAQMKTNPKAFQAELLEGKVDNLRLKFVNTVRSSIDRVKSISKDEFWKNKVAEYCADGDISPKTGQKLNYEAMSIAGAKEFIGYCKEHKMATALEKEELRNNSVDFDPVKLTSEKATQLMLPIPLNENNAQDAKRIGEAIYTYGLKIERDNLPTRGELYAMVTQAKKDYREALDNPVNEAEKKFLKKHKLLNIKTHGEFIEATKTVGMSKTETAAIENNQYAKNWLDKRMEYLRSKDPEAEPSYFHYEAAMRYADMARFDAMHKPPTEKQVEMINQFVQDGRLQPNTLENLSCAAATEVINSVIYMPGKFIRDVYTQNNVEIDPNKSAKENTVIGYALYKSNVEANIYSPDVVAARRFERTEADKSDLSFMVKMHLADYFEQHGNYNGANKYVVEELGKDGFLDHGPTKSGKTIEEVVSSHLFYNNPENITDDYLRPEHRNEVLQDINNMITDVKSASLEQGVEKIAAKDKNIDITD